MQLYNIADYQVDPHLCICHNYIATYIRSYNFKNIKHFGVATAFKTFWPVFTYLAKAQKLLLSMMVNFKATHHMCHSHYSMNRLTRYKTMKLHLHHSYAKLYNTHNNIHNNYILLWYWHIMYVHICNIIMCMHICI